MEYSKPFLEAEELLKSKDQLHAGNIKAKALKAGYSFKEANSLENQMLLQEMGR